MDASAIWESLGDWHVWGVVLVTAVLGAVGGLAHAAAQNPAGLPDTALRWWKQALVGAIAAVGVIVVAKDLKGLQWIASALIAGYAGDTVMAALAARFTAALEARKAEAAERKADALRDGLEKHRGDARELVEIVNRLRLANPDGFAAVDADDRFLLLEKSYRGAAEHLALAAPAPAAMGLALAKPLTFTIKWSGAERATLPVLRDNGRDVTAPRLASPGRITVTWDADPGQPHSIDWNLVSMDAKLTRLGATGAWEGAAASPLGTPPKDPVQNWNDAGSLRGSP